MTGVQTCALPIYIDILDSRDNSAGDCTQVVGNQFQSSKYRPAGSKAIGSVADNTNNRVIYIYAYYDDSLSKYKSYMIAGTPGNFDLVVMLFDDFLDGEISHNFDSLITSMFVKGEYVIWVDQNDKTYMLNIDKGIAKYQPFLTGLPEPYGQFFTPQDIEIAKRPPVNSPYVYTTFENRPSGEKYFNEAFWIYGQERLLPLDGVYMFATRFIYKDGSVSTMSPYTRSIQVKQGASGIRVYYYDSVEGSGPEPQDIYGVDKVEMIVKYGNDGVAYVVDHVPYSEYRKGARFEFYDIGGKTALADKYVAKPFESVPIYNKVAESVKHKIVLGYNTEGYPTPNDIGLSIEKKNIGVDVTGYHNITI